MQIAYVAVTLTLAAMAASSGLGKLRHDPKIVHVVHEVVGTPMQYFPYLAACEWLGALGLLAGIWLPVVGLAAGIGLAIYFLGAIVSHIRVNDLQGTGPAGFLLGISIAAVVLRTLAH